MDNRELITECLSSPALITIEKKSFDVAFTALLDQVVKLSGRTLTEDQIRLYIDEMFKDIQREFSWLRAGELRFALEQGAKGFFGDVFDVSYQSLVKWIKAYRDSDERRAIVMELSNKKPLAQIAAAEPTAEEIAARRFEHIREMSEIAWSIFTNNMNGKLNIADSRIFMLIPEDAFFYLETKGLLDMSKEEKKAMLAHVRNVIETMKKNDDRASGRIGESLFAVDLDREEDFVKSCARKYAVAVYFNKLLTSGKKFSTD